MKILLNNDRGFVGFELLLILLVVAIAGGAVWLELHSVHKKPASVKQVEVSTQTPKSSNSNTSVIPSGDKISTADGMVNLMLPDGWSISGGGNTIAASSRAHCLNSDDPSPCQYESAFQPKEYVVSNDQGWHLSIEKSAMTYGEASDSLLTNLSVDNIIEQNVGPLEDYESFYIKARGDSYVDIHYFISDKGYLLHFWNREQSSGTTKWDNSKYSPDFDNLILSLKLNF
ncbi:hypothetical protein BH10PAT3_BH10PAT3_1190 [soil metagenome]